MKNKKVYASPEVKGIHILPSVRHHNSSSKDDDETKLKDERRKELELANDEAYKKGKSDAEQHFMLEIEKLKTEYASLVTLFEDAAKQLINTREKIWQESEHEIVKLVLAISRKTIGYEIDNNSVNIMKHVVKEALSHVGDKKIVAIRISPEDFKKLNTLEGMKIVDQNIKVLEDRTVTPGGCTVETDFGNVDSQIETRWEEIKKTLLGNNNEPTVH